MSFVVASIIAINAHRLERPTNEIYMLFSFRLLVLIFVVTADGVGLRPMMQEFKRKMLKFKCENYHCQMSTIPLGHIEGKKNQPIMIIIKRKNSVIVRQIIYFIIIIISLVYIVAEK